MEKSWKWIGQKVWGCSVLIKAHLSDIYSFYIVTGLKKKKKWLPTVTSKHIITIWLYPYFQ